MLLNFSDQRENWCWQQAMALYRDIGTTSFYISFKHSYSFTIGSRDKSNNYSVIIHRTEEQPELWQVLGTFSLQERGFMEHGKLFVATTSAIYGCDNELTDWLTGGLTDWLTEWLTVCLSVCLSDWLTDILMWEVRSENWEVRCVNNHWIISLLHYWSL